MAERTIHFPWNVKAVGLSMQHTLCVSQKVLAHKVTSFSYCKLNQKATCYKKEIGIFNFAIIHGGPRKADDDKIQ